MAEVGDMPEPLPASPLRMQAGDTALLVVDMQEKLLTVVPRAERIVWNCRRLVDGARILGVATATTVQNPEKLGPMTAELASRLESPRAKLAFSCGECGEIFAGWREAGIERVLVAGIEAHVCVQQTVLDLLAAGYQVYVAADAVGARGTLDHEIAIRRMDSAGATITTTEAALFEWCGAAGTDSFRQISALAKEPAPLQSSCSAR